MIRATGRGQPAMPPRSAMPVGKRSAYSVCRHFYGTSHSDKN